MGPKRIFFFLFLLLLFLLLLPSDDSAAAACQKKKAKIKERCVSSSKIPHPLPPRHPHNFSSNTWVSSGSGLFFAQWQTFSFPPLALSPSFYLQQSRHVIEGHESFLLFFLWAKVFRLWALPTKLFAEVQLGVWAASKYTYPKNCALVTLFFLSIIVSPQVFKQSLFLFAGEGSHNVKKRVGQKIMY